MTGLFLTIPSAAQLVKMNWKGRGRKWPNLRYYPGIFRKELSKTIKIFSQNNISPRRELNSGHPKYEEVVTARARRSVRAV
jgi:hypothetical protein